MPEPRMPDQICDWMKQQSWDTHHLLWHSARKWFFLNTTSQQWVTSMGVDGPNTIQEGADGNGIEFLVMHRSMIQTLLDQFPTQAAYFAGWSTPPQDPDDDADPMPLPATGNSQPRPFDSNLAQAIIRLEGPLVQFASEDEFGRYLETKYRPTPGNPFDTVADPTAGLHNYLHKRFDDPTSDIHLGDPQVNLFNQRFWRLHGWIDRRWTAYRLAAGLLDTDPTYRAALASQSMTAGDMGHMHMGPDTDAPMDLRMSFRQR